MFKKRFGIFIAVFVLSLSGIIIAQDTTDRNVRDQEYKSDTFQQDGNTTSQAWVDDLRSRLNLSDDQVTQLNDVMVRFNRESSTLQDTPETIGHSRAELQKRYSTEIESILDENQRTQWQAYKDTWWNNVNAGAHQDGTEFNQQNQKDTETDVETPEDNTETETDPEIR